MSSLGEVVRRLRTWRQLTQDALAERAGCDKETIARVEQGRQKRWRPSKAMALLRALHEVAPLTDEEAHEFAAAAGLDASIADQLANHVELDKRAVATRAHVLLDELIDRVGSRRAMDVLLSTLALVAQSEPREITVAGRPRQTELGVEQEYTDYEVREPPDAEGSRRAEGD